MEDNDFETLKSDDALRLLKQGRNAWNEWVEENPDYHVDFSGVDFSEKYLDAKQISFAGFNFPKGHVSFEDTYFGNADVVFSNTNFGSGGHVSFTGAIFGDGDVGFSGAKFGDGNKGFNEVQFGSGTVDFSGAEFGDGDVWFDEAHFGDGMVLFTGATFGKGKVDFSGVTIGKGESYFNAITFGDGDVNFAGVNFGEGIVDFSQSIFGDGDISFTMSTFSKEGAYFFGSTFAKNKVNFTRTNFQGMALFTDLTIIKDIKGFSFKYTSFEGPLDISCADGEEFPCLIDLTHTKISHHVSVAGLRCILPREENRKSRFYREGDWATQKTAIDPEDEDRARRLKALAQDNKDYDKAKEFHIMEMQAARKHSKCPISYLWHSDFWYEKLSWYGSSIKRPLWGMAGLWFIWLFLYMAASAWITNKAPLFQSAIYSFAQMFAFIPSSRGARNDIGDSLFCNIPDCTIPEWIYLLTFSQSLLALTLLFLLGLGLRHRYRI